jgi:hypothetical protein
MRNADGNNPIVWVRTMDKGRPEESEAWRTNASGSRPSGRSFSKMSAARPKFQHGANGQGRSASTSGEPLRGPATAG